jgi:hypothetical protein
MNLLGGNLRASRNTFGRVQRDMDSNSPPAGVRNNERREGGTEGRKGRQGAKIEI